MTVKTPDKIKLALNLCWKTRWEIGFAVCNDCPYVSAVKPTCKEALERDVREYIYQLEAERDAAVADVKSLCATNYFSGDFCAYCKHNEPDGQCHHPCIPYSNKWGWEWRGVQKEE